MNYRPLSSTQQTRTGGTQNQTTRPLTTKKGLRASGLLYTTDCPGVHSFCLGPLCKKDKGGGHTFDQYTILPRHNKPHGLRRVRPPHIQIHTQKLSRTHPALGLQHLSAGRLHHRVRRAGVPLARRGQARVCHIMFVYEHTSFDLVYLWEYVDQRKARLTDVRVALGHHEQLEGAP